jgi:hypothetical protein
VTGEDPVEEFPAISISGCAVGEIECGLVLLARDRWTVQAVLEELRLG